MRPYWLISCRSARARLHFVAVQSSAPLHFCLPVIHSENRITYLQLAGDGSALTVADQT